MLLFWQKMWLLYNYYSQEALLLERAKLVVESEFCGKEACANEVQGFLGNIKE